MKKGKQVKKANVKKKALIVEDDPISREILSVYLSGMDLEVFLAGNGIEAQEVIREIPPDIIISDMAMPGMDGLELLKWAKSDSTISSVPFLVVSASTDHKVRENSMKFGAAAYFDKTISKMELCDAIRHFLGS